MSSQARLSSPILFWCFAVVGGIGVTFIINFVGYWIAGMVASHPPIGMYGSREFYEAVRSYWLSLVWIVHPCAAIAGGTFVGLSARRLGGDSWAALLAPAVLYATWLLQAIRNGGAIEATLQCFLLGGLSWVSWRVTR